MEAKIPEGAVATQPAHIPSRTSILSQRNLRISDINTFNTNNNQYQKQQHFNTNNPYTQSPILDSPDHHICSGWLQKRNKHHAWQKRWFVLRQSHLAYYKDEREYKPKDIIPMSDVMAVARVDAEDTDNLSKSKSGKPRLAFYTPSRNYQLRAETKEEADMWVSKLKDALEEASSKVLSSSFVRLSVLENRDMTLTNFSAKSKTAKRASMSDFSSHHPTSMGRLALPRALADNGMAKSVETDHTVSTGGSNSLFSAVQARSVSSVPSEILVSPNDLKGPMQVVNNANSSGIGFEARRRRSDLSSFGVDDDEEEDEEEEEDDGSVVAQHLPQELEQQPQSRDSHHIEILEQGTVMRLKKRYKIWQSQYLVLTRQFLYFYKKATLMGSKKPQKTLSVAELVDVVELDNNSYGKKKFGMQLITTEKRMVLSCETENDLIKWMAAIKFVIDQAPTLNISGGPGMASGGVLHYGMIEEEE